MKENFKDNINTQYATPVMKQFWDAKASHPNSIMLFRMGDFYETFDEDAKVASEILGIALTKRSNGAASSVPLAGFPYHSQCPWTQPQYPPARSYRTPGAGGSLVPG